MKSLRYWAETLHIEVFRFYSGSILGGEPVGIDLEGGIFCFLKTSDAAGDMMHARYLLFPSFTKS
ncbi:hypothetical protein AGE07_23630 [Salmonella enterica subsp. enterica serovar Kentucky]|nr:hypothetical protein AGE07_23630 [Salmonella enterica subsp. enterica serovar Kentucky]